jgi:transposase
LAPTLRQGDIVLLDNLASHKIAGIKEAIAAQGADLLYLPPYSPDLNPIEQAFAKFKAALAKAAELTREAAHKTGRHVDLVLDHAGTAQQRKRRYRRPAGRLGAGAADDDIAQNS